MTIAHLSRCYVETNYLGGKPACNLANFFTAIPKNLNMNKFIQHHAKNKLPKNVIISKPCRTHKSFAKICKMALQNLINV